MQLGSHDKPNSETRSLFLISTQCLHPSTFSLSFASLPSFSPVCHFHACAAPFPFCIFFSWCEMNIKAMLGQLRGLQQNLIGLPGP